MSKKYSPAEFANLSDEEIMSMSEAPVIEPEQEEESVNEEAGTAAEELQAAADPSNTPDPADASAGDPPEAEDSDGDTQSEDEGQADGDEEDPDTSPESEGDAEEGEEADASAGTPDPEKGEDGDEDGEVEPAKSETKEFDYKAAYEQIMAPFKANGKEIKLDNPEEAIRLMQMGANYTKKLQALQPNLKLLKMLENNGLLEESKLSFLIDLEKKNPAAIQKLLKDGNIDPMDVDTSSEPEYKPGDYQVSDQEMAFTTTLEEVSSDEVGRGVISEINKTWDARSKQALWDDPEILRVMTEQKKQGIYDAISAEITKRRTIGTLSQTVPFLAAYKSVGDELATQGLLAPQAGTQSEPQAQQTRQPVGQRVASKGKKASNGDKVRAAAPAKSSAKKVQQDFNPLAMSDEEFEKSAALANKL